MKDTLDWTLDVLSHWSHTVGALPGIGGSCRDLAAVQGLDAECSVLQELAMETAAPSKQTRNPQGAVGRHSAEANNCDVL